MKNNLLGFFLMPGFFVGMMWALPSAANADENCPQYERWDIALNDCVSIDTRGSETVAGYAAGNIPDAKRANDLAPPSTTVSNSAV